MWSILLPIVSKIGGYVFVALVVGGGFLWFRQHERSVGAEECQAEVAAAVATEQKREQDINAYWDKWAAGAIADADAAQAARANLLAQIAQLSAANDKSPGLDAAAVVRHNQLLFPGGSKARPASSSRRANR